jgi:putative phage-type endonuclease
MIERSDYMKRILDKRGMTETDWQKYREKQQGLGGSDCSIIMGLNPYKSPFVLWLEMTGQAERPKLDSRYVEWGNLLEPVIRDKFRAETGFVVKQCNFVLAHQDYEWMVANVDGFVIDPSRKGRGVLEIKTANERAKKDWENGCPNHYMLQVQHYLAVTELDYAYIAVLIGGSDFRYYFIERDDYVIDAIISAEREFMEMVRLRKAPVIGGSESEADWLAAAYPNAIDIEETLMPHQEELVAEYHILTREINEKQARADEIKNTIKLLAEDKASLRGETFRVSMPTIKKVMFDSKSFAADYPELYSQYKTKESSYRGFTIKIL